MTRTATTVAPLAWVDGTVVDLAEASIPLTAPGLHYGTGAFEGARAYSTGDGLALFRIDDHLERLERSAATLRLTIPHSLEDLRIACRDLVRRNGPGECYVRPVVIAARPHWGLGDAPTDVLVAILTWPWPSFFGSEGMADGIRLMTSSVRWPDPTVLTRSVKLTGAYVNSTQASIEATAAGFDEALMLTSDGRVADTAGDNVFFVTNGTLVTPDRATGILPGITRDTLLQLAVSLGLRVEERRVTAEELGGADEVFVCGTSSEVTPVRAIDGRSYAPGHVTRQLQRTYLDVVHGRMSGWAHWLDHVG